MKKWEINRGGNYYHSFPENELGIVYDSDDRVLFGTNFTKGKVTYSYIPAKFMETGNRYIVHSSINYDGKGNVDLPQDAEIIAFEHLYKTFPDNDFK